MTASPNPAEGTQTRFAAPERYNQWPQADLHTQWPGKGAPGDPIFDQFFGSQVPGIQANSVQLNRDALLALLDKIGPAILMTHSQSGPIGWPVADARPDLVKALICRAGRPSLVLNTFPDLNGSRTGRRQRTRGASPAYR
jgi:pimeloyl-ACP methyl ester carboxylesterase